MSENLTKKINTIDKNYSFALEASAGTGKTFQLALRVASLLLSGINPRDILCLTFTNKATNEMLERIIKTLKDLSLGLETDEIKEIIYPHIMQIAVSKNEEFSPKFVKNLSTSTLQKLLMEFSSLNIKTIDAYINLILRIFPFESDTRVDFEILSTTANEDLINEVFVQTISNLLDKKSWSNLFDTLTDILNATPITIMDLIKSYLEFIIDNHFSLRKALNEIILTPDEIMAMIDETRTIKISTMTLMNLFTISFENKVLNKNQTKHIDKLRSIKTINDIIKQFAKNPIEHHYFKKFDFTSDQVQLSEQILDNLRRYLKLKARIAEAVALSIGKIFYHNLERAKNNNNQTTHSDITEKVYYILNNQNQPIDKAYLYFRLDSNVSHILLDEFQDTSVVQWEILEPLADESMSGIGQKDSSGSFFYVGDPKQNLYRFRGSSSRLFANVRDYYKSKYERFHEVKLEKNFRSDKYIVEFVNIVANEAVKSFPSSAIEKIFSINQLPLDSKDNGFVTVDIIPRNAVNNSDNNSDDTSDDNSDDTSGKPFVEFSLKKIKMLIENGYEYKDIALLLPTNKMGSELKTALSKNGIHAKVETSSSLIDTDIFKIFSSLIKFIFFDDDLAFLTYAFIFPTSFSKDLKRDKSEMMKIKNHIRNIANGSNLSIFEKILAVIDQSNIMTRFKDEPDLEQILDLMAKTVPNESNPRQFLKRFIETASDLQSISLAKENAVTIITINKAKGLQFKVVILPKLDLPFNPFGHKPPLFLLNDSGRIGEATMQYVHTQDALPILPEFNELIENEHSRTIEDNLNKLYVALTRAEHGLIVAATSKAKNSNGEINNISSFLSADKISSYNKGDIKNKIQSQIDRSNMKQPAIWLEPKTATKEEIRYSGKTINYHSTSVGTFAHLALFFLDSLDTVAVDTAINHAINLSEKTISATDIEDIRATLYNLIQDDLYSQLFKGTIFKEHSIGKNGQLFKIDIFSILADKIILVDYKYAEYDSVSEKNYSKQITKYANILYERYKMPIESYIFYLTKNSIKKSNILT